MQQTDFLRVSEAEGADEEAEHSLPFQIVCDELKTQPKAGNDPKRNMIQHEDDM
jgi:hypothetical protein